MNYDLCDLLNKKMEQSFDYFSENCLSKSIFKNTDFIDDYLEKKYFENYISLIDNNITSNQNFGVWIYRNGLFSNQIADFELAAKKITRELANLTYSNNPSYDIMYFSGVIKMIFAPNKCIYLETCSKPTLNQLMALKDFEKKILSASGILVWKIIDRKNRNSFIEGLGLEDLFGYKWSRIK